jgi:peptide/nickel transport system permease protein
VEERVVLRVVLWRVVGAIVLVTVLTFVTYIVWWQVPVDPLIYLAPDATAEEKAQIRHELGLDEPVLERWGSFTWRLWTEGDLGNTLGLLEVPVNDVLTSHFPPTISLVLGGFALMLALAIPLGMLSALKARSLFDRALLAVVVLGIVLHPFIVGLVLRNVFSTRLGIAPPGGYCPLRGQAQVFTAPFEYSYCGGVVDWAYHMWLPWLTFALFFLPIYTRMVRARTLDTLRQPFVLTARAKGASEQRVMMRHVARNALGPVAAMLAVDVAVIITAAIYVETVFGLPGLGTVVVNNVSGQYGYDLPTLNGIVVLMVVAITIVNLLADVTVRALDPRTRLERASAR